jgi:hypothetical protein
MKKVDNNRKYPGIRGSRRPDLKKFKQEEALERQKTYDALTVEEKVAKLDYKLGKGIGAKSQREKLNG